jgi:hypothetical protein
MSEMHTVESADRNDAAAGEAVIREAARIMGNDHLNE